MTERADQEGQEARPEDTGSEMNPEQWQNFLITGKRPSAKDFVIIVGSG